MFLFSEGRKSSGPIALEIDDSNHLRIAVEVNGMSAIAILDTGAARSILDLDFATRHGVRLRRGLTIAGIAGDTSGYFADTLTIKIGDLTITEPNAGALKLSTIIPTVNDQVDVIIGREVFSSLWVDLDIDAKSVEFAAPDQRAPPADALPIPLAHTIGGTPYIPISINGADPTAAGFDLGYNASVLVSMDYAEHAGLLRDRPVSTVASRGVEGLSISRIATLDRITVGGVDFAQVPFEVPERWNRKIPVILGFEILSRFRILTDYPRSTIWLSADEHRVRAPLQKDRSGIGAALTPSGLRIMHVAQGSPAEACGLRVGDHIVRIDGERVDAVYLSAHPRMGARPAGTQSQLGLADGRVLTLILSDYY